MGSQWVGWAYLMGAILFEVVGTSLLRDTQGFTRLLPSAVVVVTYIVAVFFMTLASRDLPLGVVYTVWSALGTVMIFGIGAARFGELPGTPVIIGAAMIIVGTGVMSFGTAMQIE